MRFKEVGVDGGDYHDCTHKQEYEANDDKTAPSCLDKVDLLRQQNLCAKIPAYTNDEKAKTKRDKYETDGTSNGIICPVVVSGYNVAMIVNIWQSKFQKDSETLKESKRTDDLVDTVKLFRQNMQ